VDYTGYECSAILVEHLEHHAVIAHTETLKGPRQPPDCLDPLSSGSTRIGEIDRQPLEACSDAVTDRRRELPELPRRCLPELDAVRLGQSSSERGTVRPRR